MIECQRNDVQWAQTEMEAKWRHRRLFIRSSLPATQFPQVLLLLHAEHFPAERVIATFFSTSPHPSISLFPVSPNLNFSFCLFLLSVSLVGMQSPLYCMCHDNTLRQENFERRVFILFLIRVNSNIMNHVQACNPKKTTKRTINKQMYVIFLG